MAGLHVSLSSMGVTLPLETPGNDHGAPWLIEWIALFATLFQFGFLHDSFLDSEIGVYMLLCNIGLLSTD